MDVEDDHPPEEELEEARQPTLTDLVSLCRELNDREGIPIPEYAIPEYGRTKCLGFETDSGTRD